MNYPLISEYVEAIRYAEDNFKTLTDLRAVLDDDGRPVMSSGNFAVVFKMRDQRDGSFHAVKCFTRDVPGRDDSYRLIAEELRYVVSPYLTGMRYLDDELFVDSAGNADSEFPVLMMDWVEGQTLDAYIRNCYGDTYRLSLLAWEFSRLGEWLLTQPFAHGDLKPDNILVRADGTLVLVDYDGMYVPAMQGQTAHEEGSPDFRHPLRTAATFNEHIDDFAIISILLSLRAIAHDPSLMDRYGAADRLLLSAADYRDPSQCTFLRQEFPTGAPELDNLYGLFFVALANTNLSHVSARLLRLARPEEPEEVLVSTEVTREEIKNGIEDEYGVVYSPDGTRLLKCRNNSLGHYVVKEECKVICDYAFDVYYGTSLPSVVLPVGLTHIGDFAFSGCGYLTDVTLPKYLSYIGINPFAFSCVGEIKSNSPRFIFSDGFLIDKAEKRLIAWMSDESEAIVPEDVTYIGDSAFLNCENLTNVTFPDNLMNIGDLAFSKCKKLKNVMLPKNLSNIGKNPFAESDVCEIKSKSSRFIFSGGFLIDKAEKRLIAWMSDESEAIVPSGVTHIGKWTFSLCKNLKSVTLPANLIQIEDLAFSWCNNLHSIYVPYSEKERYKAMLSQYTYKII